MKFFTIVRNSVSNRVLVFLVFTLFAIVASIQSLSGTKTYEENGTEYTKYNNYIIFEKSFEHLKENKDLYILYPEEQWDLYKYTPTFSVFFGVFWMMPDWLGLNAWNILNALLLLAAIYYIPYLNNHQKGIISLIILIELLTSMQNSQSNGLMAGFIVFAFGFLERRKDFSACFSVLSSVFVKLFGIVAFAFFIFYPRKFKFFALSILSLLLLALPPLIFIDIEQYLELIKSYLALLSDDHQSSHGYSIMGILQTWFGIYDGKELIVFIGVILFFLPLIRIKMYQNFKFKYLTVCSVLLWIVIFNHKAESPTFIIAMMGVAMWYVISEKNYLNISLLIFALIFTTFSSTDLFPRDIRLNFIQPYAIKAVPCILIWLKILYDQITLSEKDQLNNSTSNLLT